jgi:D-serine deaminase-like pyridoxal phosphate-dependent protein
VGKRRFKRLELMELADLTLVADFEAAIRSYTEFAEHVGRLIPVLVEVDTGVHRVGIAPEPAVVLENMIVRSDGLEFLGIVTHAGSDVQVISAGSTITAAYFRPDDGVTEIRRGTCTYNGPTNA